MATIPKQPGTHRRRWSKEEYYRLGELGFFRGQRVELIEGELMVQSPQNPLHAATTDAVRAVLEILLGTGYLARCQFPLDLGQTTEPEPDVAVVAGTRWQYLHAHPTTAVLIVEVSESTLAYDRSRKGSLYARAGIADYWIVNLVDRQIEVYRDPLPDSTQPYGHRYASRSILAPPATLIPLALPQVAVAVADLLP